MPRPSRSHLVEVDRAPDAGRTRVVGGLLRGRSASPSASRAGTATATGSATTGPTRRSTPRRRQLLDEPGPHRHPAAAHQPVPTRPVRRGYAQANCGPRAGSGHRPGPRRLRPYARACRTPDDHTHGERMSEHHVPAQEDGGATILEIGAAAGCLARGREPRQRGRARHSSAPLPSGPTSGSCSPAQAARPSRARSPRPRCAVTSAAGSTRSRRPTSSPARSITWSADTPTLLVSFGRSGNSPESLATTALADALRRRSLASRPHLRPRRQAGPRARRPRGLARRLHARAHQRRRVRHDVEPHLDVVVVPAHAGTG